MLKKMGLDTFHGEWMTCPELLNGLNYKSKGEDSERKRSWGALPSSQHFGGRRACCSSKMGLGRITSKSITHTDLHKPNKNWLMQNQSTFGAQMNHEQTPTHKTHHGLDLGEATTFPLIVLFVLGHGVNTQMAFCPETPKWEFQNSQNQDFCNFGVP